ncbi:MULTISPECIES: hypothetical protein [unclassified Streptomyces]|uniref:hypothetical protein n=1 Tax=unclassified Streptomyces TaxID=2593676 RepID=UPI0022550599|nr:MULTISPECIES: hypothetical protein [unclassified Streptomyces]MCX4647048.1 hypothetical protein [Streptomyces sp. NBC_01446]MCX5326925.1 hypothetical protein [Streptomyces sp. NBC_00120]
MATGSAAGWQKPTALVALRGSDDTIYVPSWTPDRSPFAFVDYLLRREIPQPGQ